MSISDTIFDKLVEPKHKWLLKYADNNSNVKMKQKVN